MLKNSGTQENNKKVNITGNINIAVRFDKGKKIKNMIFHKFISFLVINKLSRSAYPCTPSGNPKLKLWLSLLIPKLFSYPLQKAKAV